MERIALEGGLCAANARVASGQQALLEQRAQVRELEQWGLDASMAKALLRIYEESHAMSILERRRLYDALASASACEPSPLQDNHQESLATDGVIYRKAA
jgi:hypothetical protein